MRTQLTTKHRCAIHFGCSLLNPIDDGTAPRVVAAVSARRGDPTFESQDPASVEQINLTRCRRPEPLRFPAKLIEPDLDTGNLFGQLPQMSRRPGIDLIGCGRLDKDRVRVETTLASDHQACQLANRGSRTRAFRVCEKQKSRSLGRPDQCRIRRPCGRCVDARARLKFVICQVGHSKHRYCCPGNQHHPDADPLTPDAVSLSSRCAKR